MNSQFNLNVDGMNVPVSISDTEMKTIIDPLLTRWGAMYHKKKKRIIVYMAAAPGSGKSVFAALLMRISELYETYEPVQAVGIDGFHYYQEYLSSHTCIVNDKAVLMSTVKGCPQTFDTERLHEFLSHLRQKKRITWPQYSRVTHNPEEDRICVSSNIVIVEGNYLLLNEEPWCSLLSFCDESIYLSTDESTLKDRLIRRKIAGGMSANQASKWYNDSDLVNIQKVINCSYSSDLTIEINTSGVYSRLSVQNSRKGIIPEETR